MADEEHLAILKQGVEVWNEWRRKNPGIQPDLRELNLSRIFLFGINFSKANLMGSSFRKADLRSQHDSWSGTIVFDNCEKHPLMGVNLHNINLKGCDLRGANFEETVLVDLILKGANFSNVDFRESNFSGIDLSAQNLIFSKSNFSEAILNEVNLSGLDFSGAKFIEAAINEAILVGTNFAGADFSKAALMSTNLTDANLERAKLTEATLLSANLSKANLRKANLSSAMLSGADLFKTKLVAANLSRAKIDEAILCEAELIHANLSQADLNGADLRYANFSEAILEDVNLTDAKTRAAQFVGAKVTGVCLEAQNLCETVLDKINCEYVYLKYPDQRRLPEKGVFYADEFSKLFQTNRFYSISFLESQIDRFEKLLEENFEGNESIFHNFLEKYPSLLDIYGTVESKPTFFYPKEERSAVEKTKLQPDFIIRYQDNKYKLVEIEKPEKPIATKQGRPTSKLEEPAFQIAEWEDYIDEHYELIKDKYPGIFNQKNRTRMIVIGRRSEISQKYGDPVKYMKLISRKFSCEEVYTYDDLLDKAKQAFENLKALSL